MIKGSILRAVFLLLLFSQSVSIYSVAFCQYESEVIVYEILTCKDYNGTDHYPIEVSNYFDISEAGVLLWVNTSLISNINLSAVWRFPNQTMYSDYYFVYPDVPLLNASWLDSVFFIEVEDEVPSQVLGEWSVELLQDDVSIGNHSFNIIDRTGSDWGYYAEILNIDSPERVQQNQNFTVSLTTHYIFENSTIFTPGLWDQDTGNLYNEVNETLKGEGTKTYDIEVAVWDTSGEIIIDAAAFYQIDNEWFIDDEGLLSFTILVEEQKGTSVLIYLSVLALVILLSYSLLKNRISLDRSG